jgi:hypothetical protein
MTSQAQDYLNRHRLPLHLRPVFIGHLALMESLLTPAYGYVNGTFEEVLAANEGITSDFIRDYAQNISSEIFIRNVDYEQLNEKLKEHLVKLTRSLSLGDPLKNSTRHVNLLSLQMQNLYKDPFNDELLNNQFQSTKNLSSLLFNNKNIHRQLYKNASKQNYHYTVMQPLLSSILLLSFTQHTQMFTEKEMQQLFLTSYFKDIGMSFIPREKFEQAHLSDVDKALFAEHAQNSMELLEGRVPLSKTHLFMIQNHHYLNYIIQAKARGIELDDDAMILTGVESMLLSAMDILVAMTTKRPYRDPVTAYRALEFLKRVVSDEYPQEFRTLVMYLKHFFSNK